MVLPTFMRVTTNPRFFPSPLTGDQALSRVAEWMAPAYLVVLHPGPAHPERLRALLSAIGSAGNLVMDAHLAVLAQEFQAVVVSYDNDFAMFPGVIRETPGH